MNARPDQFSGLSDLDTALAFGPLGHLLVDPNSTLGLRLEGALDRKRGKTRDENPYSIPRYKGCLAETHWFEGWDIADAKLAEQVQA